MCGRITQREPDHFDEFSELRITPRFNIPPAQGDHRVAAVRLDDAGRRVAVPMQWWLLPHWSKTRIIKYSTFNAAIEGLDAKPTYREPLRRRRCLVPADGFYEWWNDAGTKRPHFIRRRDDAPFYFAGLWDRWESASETVESFAIVTTPANALLKQIHHRSPVILPPEQQVAWLDPSLTDPARVLNLVQPFDSAAFEMFEVDRYVSNARNEGERCILPLAG